MPVTTVAATATATQLAAGTNPLRTFAQRILDNLANLFSRLGTAETTLNTKEDKANKGVAGGYASLDTGGKIPTAQIPDMANINMAANTIKGNDTGAAAAPKDLTAEEARTVLGVLPSRYYATRALAEAASAANLAVLCFFPANT
jgi:hypothetical protein